VLTVAEIVTITTALAFTMTVVHAIGLSATLGVLVLPYFTIADYVNQTVPWVSPLLLGMACGAFFWMVVSRVRETVQGRTQTTAESGSRLWLLWVLGIVLILLFFLPGFIYWLAYRSIPAAVFYGLAIDSPVIWIVFYIWWSTSPKGVRRITATQAALLLVVPILVLASFFYGASEGQSIMLRQAKDRIVRTSAEEITARYILPMQRFTVIKKADGAVVVLATDQIRQVEER